jgi:hypothetical protein
MKLILLLTGAFVESKPKVVSISTSGARVPAVQITAVPEQCKNDHLTKLLSQLHLAESLSRTDYKVCPRKTNSKEIALVKNLRSLREVGLKDYTQGGQRCTSKTNSQEVLIKSRARRSIRSGILSNNHLPLFLLYLLILLIETHNQI